MFKHHVSPLFSWAFGAIVLITALVMNTPRAYAAPPEVLASIKPVQALVKMVMGNLGTPGVIMPATASPHMFTLKPSQAKMLESAEVVFWIGPTLETTLQGPLQNLASNARVIELLEVPGLDLIKLTDEHDDEHTTERTVHEREREHDHGDVDPHIWLSPSNARIMLDAIAATLSNIDPNNAPDYAKNVKKAKKRITILIRKTKEFTDAMRPTPYLVQHDGFAYLAREFGFNEVGHIQTMPGREPGAKHVAELLEQIKSQNVKCLFHETQFSPKLARTLEKETGVLLREIDPIGIDVTLSETAYVRIIQGIIVSMESCLYPRKPVKLKKPE